MGGLDRFVAEHVRDRACSVCGGTRWYLVNEGNPISFLSFTAADNPRVDVLGVCCAECGYIRFHDSRIVSESAPGAGPPDANEP